MSITVDLTTTQQLRHDWQKFKEASTKKKLKKLSTAPWAVPIAMFGIPICLLIDETNCFGYGDQPFPGM